MDNFVGKTIRGYLMHDLIGEGGFGAVYRATQTAVDREVAIKVILPQYANRPEFIRKFEAEAKLVARLEHIHIVSLIDYWRDPEGAFLVLRWMRGGTLRDSIRQNGAWEPRQTAKVFTQVSAALTVAHRGGIVHRDVKPANILLDDEKNGYLSDFGIALDTMDDHTQTGVGGSGGVTGSAGYISPEQVNMQHVSPRSDIYSMTIVLYEMLAGMHPYPDARSAIALFIKHTSEPLPLLTNFPDSVNRVLQKGAAKNPDERYSDLLVMAQELKQALAQADMPGAPGQAVELDDFDTTGMQPALAGAAQILNPYKGLRAFQEGDAEDFYGREQLIQQLIGRMMDDHPLTRFLAVVGPSGSGKSSVVKAGLLPVLRKGGIPGSERWFYVEMLPGASPIAELEDALLSITINQLPDLDARLRTDPYALAAIAWEALPHDDSELVLVIDQFEEVFTQGSDEERIQFLEMIFEAINAPDSRVRVIVTLRADFYDRPLMVPKFSALMQQRTEVVVPLSVEEMERAITAPARRVKVFFQQGLAAAIVSEVSEQPGVLPMLQYAMTELFERREGQILTQSAYQELGGVLGALARRADEIYVELDAVQQEVTRQLFLRLVTLGEGTEDTRRRALLSELLSAARDAGVMQQIVDTYGTYRLLTFDRDPVTRTPTVEVAHEALIREWKRLRVWLDEGREDVRLQRLLSAASAEWDESRRDGSFLLRGGRLAQYEDWIGRTSISLTKLDQDYLAASIAERQRAELEEARRLANERELERRGRQRLRLLIGILILATIGGIVASIVVFNQSIEAQAARATSDINVTFALDAQRNAVTQAVKATYAQGDALVQAATAVNAQNNAVTQAAIAVVAQNEADTNASLALTQVAVANTAQAEAVVQAATATFAQGAALVQANIAETAQSEAIRLAETAVIAQNEAISLAATAVIAQDQAREEANISQSLALAASASQLSFSNSPLALALAVEANNVESPSLQAQRVLISLVFDAPRQQYANRNGTAINSVLFTPDASQIISANTDGSIIFWDRATGEMLRTLTGHTGTVNQIALSPNARSLASASEDGTVIIWDVETGEPITTFAEQGVAVNTVAFSPNGAQVASGGDNGIVYVWDRGSGNVIREIGSSSANPVNSVYYRPNGRQLLIAGDDSLRIWDFGALNFVFLRDGAGEPADTRRIKSAVYDPEGNIIVTSGVVGDGAPEEWNAERLVPLRDLPAHNGPVNSVAFSPDGQFVLSASDDSSLIMSDARTGIQIKRYAGHTNRVTSAVFSADGQFIISASGDGIMYLWDTKPRASEQQNFATTNDPEVRDSVSRVTYTPGGNVLAATDLGNIFVYDTERNVLLERRLGRPSVPKSELVLSPNATEDNLIALWANTSVRVINLTTEETLQEFTVPEPRAWVEQVAFSPDGTLALWGGAHFYRDELTDFTRVGILRLWNIETGELVHQFPIEEKVRRPVDEAPGPGQTGGAPAQPPAGATVEFEEVINEGTNASVTAVAFTNDGRYIMSGIEDGRIFMWDVVSGERVREFTGHSAAINDILFTKDGLSMLTGSADRAIILWDMNTGLLRRRFTGHTGSVNSIAFNETEANILSGSEDRSLRLWDTQTGEAIQRFAEQESPITTVTFNPEGTRALAGTLAGVVFISDIDTAESLKEWAETNRYTPDLTCSEREQYRVQPLCDAAESATATPSVTPTLTATPALTPTATGG